MTVIMKIIITEHCQKTVYGFSITCKTQTQGNKNESQRFGYRKCWYMYGQLTISVLIKIWAG